MDHLYGPAVSTHQPGHWSHDNDAPVWTRSGACFETSVRTIARDLFANPRPRARRKPRSRLRRRARRITPGFRGLDRGRDSTQRARRNTGSVEFDVYSLTVQDRLAIIIVNFVGGICGHGPTAARRSGDCVGGFDFDSTNEVKPDYHRMSSESRATR